MAVNCIVFVSGVVSLATPSARAQSVANQVEPMSREAFALSVKQAALTVCALRKIDLNYKIALKTSAVPVYQLVKFKYGMGIEGISGVIEEERLIRYLGYKISEFTLESCKETLPPEVEATIQKIKVRLGS